MTQRPTRRTFLTASVAAGGVSLVGVPGAAAGDTAGESDSDRPPLAQDPDSELRAILRDLDQRRIEATERKLVSFGTRNTLSSQDDPTRGIGAARDWLFDEFKKVALPSMGRMTVELQSYVQPVASRIPVPTPITNIVATLQGNTPDQAARTYVVSGHYDSMP